MKKRNSIFSFQKEKSVTIEHGFQQPPEAAGSDLGAGLKGLKGGPKVLCPSP